jgi:hypothetical protein
VLENTVIRRMFLPKKRKEHVDEKRNNEVFDCSSVPRNFFREGGSSNSVEDRGHRERGSGGVSPLVRGSTQFANE